MCKCIAPSQKNESIIFYWFNFPMPCHLVVTLLQFFVQKVLFQLFTKIVTYEYLLIRCFVKNRCHWIITNNDCCFNKKIRPLLQNDNNCLRFVVQLSCLLKVWSKYFIYLDMQFTVFQYTVQKQKCLEKVGTNAGVRL